MCSIDWHRKLDEAYVCGDCYEYALGFASPLDAWSMCERGDWLLWVAETFNVGKELIAKASVKIARTVAHLAYDDVLILSLDLAEERLYNDGSGDIPLRAVIEANRADKADRPVTIHKLFAAHAIDSATRACLANTDRIAYRHAPYVVSYAAKALALSTGDGNVIPSVELASLASSARIIRDVIPFELVAKGVWW